MGRIFISYARDDGSQIADEMADRLRARGHIVFLDTHSIRAGSQWRSELVKNVQKSDVVVVLVTAASNKSTFVYQEIENAKKFHKTIIPVQINNTELPRDLSGTWQAVKLENDNLDRVLLEIEGYLHPKRISPTLIGLAASAIIVVLVLGGVFFLLPALNKDDEDSLSKSDADILSTTTRTSAILYEEDFEAGTALGWIAENGLWQIIDEGTGNKVYQVSSSSYSTAYYSASSNWQNYMVELRVKPTDGSRPLIWVRTRDVRNGYFLNMDSSVAIPTKLGNTQQTDLGHFSNIHTRNGEWNIVQIEVRDSRLRFSINGLWTSDVYDDAFPTGGFGLSIQGTALFDDIRVWSLQEN